MGQTLANRMGGMARFGHHEDTEIEIFQPFKAHPSTKMVNVDVTNTKGIMRAKEMGLIASGKVDMVRQSFCIALVFLLQANLITTIRV